MKNIMTQITTMTINLGIWANIAFYSVIDIVIIDTPFASAQDNRLNFILYGFHEIK